MHNGKEDVKRDAGRGLSAWRCDVNGQGGGKAAISSLPFPPYLTSRRGRGTVPSSGSGNPGFLPQALRDSGYRFHSDAANANQQHYRVGEGGQDRASAVTICPMRVGSRRPSQTAPQARRMHNTSPRLWAASANSATECATKPKITSATTKPALRAAQEQRRRQSCRSMRGDGGARRCHDRGPEGPSWP